MYPNQSSLYIIATACDTIKECLHDDDEENCDTSSYSTPVLVSSLLGIFGIFIAMKISHVRESRSKKEERVEAEDEEGLYKALIEKLKENPSDLPKITPTNPASCRSRRDLHNPYAILSNRPMATHIKPMSSRNTNPWAWNPPQSIGNSKKSTVKHPPTLPACWGKGHVGRGGGCSTLDFCRVPMDLGGFLHVDLYFLSQCKNKEICFFLEGVRLQLELFVFMDRFGLG